MEFITVLGARWRPCIHRDIPLGLVSPNGLGLWLWGKAWLEASSVGNHTTLAAPFTCNPVEPST